MVLRNNESFTAQQYIRNGCDVAIGESRIICDDSIIPSKLVVTRVRVGTNSFIVPTLPISNKNSEKPLSAKFGGAGG
jgi:hypothetical protein